MKGLLYKDLCILLKQMKFVLLMVAVFCLCMSLYNGFTLFFVLYISILTPMSLLSFDERSKWDTFAEMLPYSTRSLVLSKYICGWLILGYTVILYAVGLVIASPGHTFGQDALLHLTLFLSAALLLQGLYYPVLFRFGVEKGRLAMIIVMAVVGVIGFGLFPLVTALGLSGFAPLVGVLLLGIAVCGGSVFVSEKLYRKGRGR